MLPHGSSSRGSKLSLGTIKNIILSYFFISAKNKSVFSANPFLYYNSMIKFFDLDILPFMESKACRFGQAAGTSIAIALDSNVKSLGVHCDCFGLQQQCQVKKT
jgi:hypothetical protein